MHAVGLGLRSSVPTWVRPTPKHADLYPFPQTGACRWAVPSSERLRSVYAEGLQGPGSGEVFRILMSAGIEREVADSCIEKVEEGRMSLCVQSRPSE